MNAGDRCGACVFICNHKEENMVLNTSKSMLDKIAWLNKQEDITKFSKLQLQKFLFLYEMFQFVEKKDSDFTYLKAYKNGPVFSNFYGDITYREAEVQDYLKQKQCDFDIDESNARISQFIINTLTDSELSDLTHQFKMWSTHKEEIDAGKDFSDKLSQSGFPVLLDLPDNESGKVKLDWNDVLREKKADLQCMLKTVKETLGYQPVRQSSQCLEL